MKKIITKGMKEENKRRKEEKRLSKLRSYVYLEHCSNCGCTFTFEYDDIVTCMYGIRYTRCPQCNDAVEIVNLFFNRYEKRSDIKWVK